MCFCARRGPAALHAAVIGNKVDMVLYLLENGATVDPLNQVCVCLVTVCDCVFVCACACVLPVRTILHACCRFMTA